MSKPTLQVVVASTRPGRVGPVVSDWFVRLAEEHGGFEVKVTDLAELALPLLDEPHHPRLRQYQHQHPHPHQYQHQHLLLLLLFQLKAK